MQTSPTNSVSRDIADDSIILNIHHLDERELINRYFVDETNSFSYCETMIAA